MRRLLAAALLVLLAVAGAGACAPVVMPAGPPTQAAALAEDAIVAADGARLPLRHWEPQPEVERRGVILALHGFNDYSRAFRRSAPWFAEQGWIVYAYDQRGFGGAPNRGYWAGADTLAEDARTAARLVAARHPGLPLVLMGESMGGAVLMLAATEGRGAPHDALVLLAPAVRGFTTLDWFQRNALEFAAHALGPLGVYGSTPTVRASDNSRVLRELGRDPNVIKTTRMDTLYGLVSLMDRALAAGSRLDGTVPTLIVYGAQDQLVPPRVVRALLARLPAGAADEPRIALYPRGFHLLLRDRIGRELASDVLAFLADPAAPLPSGADRRGATALAALRGGAGGGTVTAGAQAARDSTTAEVPAGAAPPSAAAAVTTPPTDATVALPAPATAPPG